MNLLVLSTLSCILDHVIPFFIKFIISYMFVEQKDYIELQNELSNLKKEMAGLSMVDEFAKYAKLQRKCNQVENILKENKNQRLSSRLKLQMSLTYTFRVLNGVLILFLLFMYKKEPVIILSEGMLWPIQDFLSWPSQHDNAISLAVWVVIARLGIFACKNLHL
ncbi:guided entry of tail-anchored proteins factor 1 [Linepithema humile]|uniref:guided entry of tail-anchored proteins factor 1 n=1 Tax=Linepithema humile TaxID=83485 RepID=UPI0006239AE1|nr:PREDICTED: tail-anchored protein insertion receptor WRB-like [Linepithema humile]